MTRAFLALTLWSLCVVVGLLTTRKTAENAEMGQRLTKKWDGIHWSREAITDLSNEIERNRYASGRTEETHK